MRGNRIVYVSEEAHRRLKLLAAQRGRAMGQMVEELVRQEIEDQQNPWTGPAGLALQESVLREAWDDPALDVYDD